MELLKPGVDHHSSSKITSLRILKLLGYCSAAAFTFTVHHQTFLLSSPLDNRFCIGESMDMNTLNVSATLNIFRLLAKPDLCLPQATVATFNNLPIPLNKAFGKYQNVNIKAVVLDKDNCFAYPKSNQIHKPYNVSFSCGFALAPFCLGVKMNIKKSHILSELWLCLTLVVLHMCNCKESRNIA